MIIVTGGAGFIDSFLQGELATDGYRTDAIAWLGSETDWRIVAGHPPSMITKPRSAARRRADLAGQNAVDQAVEFINLRASLKASIGASPRRRRPTRAMRAMPTSLHRSGTGSRNVLRAIC